MPESAQQDRAFHAQLSSFFWLQINSAHLQQELVISITCFHGHGEDLGFFFFPFSLIQCFFSQEDPCKNKDSQFELVTLLFTSHFAKTRLFLQNAGETCIKNRKCLQAAVPARSAPQSLVTQQGTEDQPYFTLPKAFPNIIHPICFLKCVKL